MRKQPYHNHFSNLFLAVCFFVLLVNCGNNKEPTKIGYFKTGQILLPDYVCPDTLIVMDAESLNKNFAYYEQNINWGSDSDIDSLLHCSNAQDLPACMDYYQYIDFKVQEGYKLEIAKHLANVDFKKIAPNSAYYAIIED